MARTNEHGQPIGEASPRGWMPPPAPSAVTLEGAFVRVEPLDPPAHAADLFEAGRVDTTGASWTYLPDGPVREPRFLGGMALEERVGA